MNSPQSILFVLGSHRSGTSLASHLAALSGASLLPDSLLATGGDANPEGFWEYQNLTRLNELAFRRLGAHWSAPPSPEEVALRHHHELFGRAAVWRARRRFGAVNGTVLWKDPRLCVLVSLWTQALRPRSLHAVIVIRRPIEVAISLQRRNGLETDLGLALWSAYTMAALATSNAIPTYLVTFERLVNCPASYVSGLAAAMKTASLPTASDYLTDKAPASFVRPELYRSRTPEISANSSELGRESDRLYRELVKLERDQVCSFAEVEARNDRLTEMTDLIIAARRAQLADRIEESLRPDRRIRSGARYAGYAAAARLRHGRDRSTAALDPTRREP
jgi:hypothetical protein